MKSKSFIKYCTTLALASGVLLVLLQGCQEAPESYEAQIMPPVEAIAGDTTQVLNIDTLQSYIQWIGTKPTGTHTGFFEIKKGKIYLDRKTIIGGMFFINMASLKVQPSGSPADDATLVKHLKSADFFDVALYPTACFELTGVEPYPPPGSQASDNSYPSLPRPSHLVTGNLTIRNVTKGISFPAQLFLTKKQLTAIANFNINRTNWGITYNKEGTIANRIINNSVNISLNLVAKAHK